VHRQETINITVPLPDGGCQGEKLAKDVEDVEDIEQQNNANIKVVLAHRTHYNTGMQQPRYQLAGLHFSTKSCW